MLLALLPKSNSFGSKLLMRDLALNTDSYKMNKYINEISKYKINLINEKQCAVGWRMMTKRAGIKEFTVTLHKAKNYLMIKVQAIIHFKMNCIQTDKKTKLWQA